MNDKLKQLTDVSGKWIPVSQLDDVIRVIVSELRTNGYDDAAQCLIDQYLTNDYITIED